MAVVRNFHQIHVFRGLESPDRCGSRQIPHVGGFWQEIGAEDENGPHIARNWWKA
jgi:hypothetical protein